MATASKVTRRFPDDSEPVVFPEQAGSVKVELDAGGLGPNSDLLIDPNGNLYCYVCRVSVPKGSSNISQHLSGKKHETNNRRFLSEQDKLHTRDRYVKAAAEQRGNGSALPASIPTASEPELTTLAAQSHTFSSAPPAFLPTIDKIDKNSTNAGRNIMKTMPTTQDKRMSDSDVYAHPIPVASRSKGIDKAKRGKLKEQAGKLRAVCIDKKAYLAQLLAADSNESESDLESIDSLDLSATTAHMTDSNDLQERHRPFGPLEFNPSEGTISFFDSVAAESEPTGNAAAVREILAASPVVKENVNHRNGAVTLHEKSPSGTGSLMSADGGHMTEYIKLVEESEGTQEIMDGRKGQKRAGQVIPQSTCILKDTNGEELPAWLLDPCATENVLYTGDSSISLHYEILEFAKFVSPTEKELSSRNDMIVMVKSIVKQLWPESNTQVFGSYATGLYLPSSDIDICIMGTPLGGELREFEQLAEAIRNVGGFARRVNVLAKAKVPLVKIIARETSMNCDICIGRENGPQNVPVINKYLERFPALRPLLLVVKCFLKQRDLNEVFSGGLGSYTVLLLVVSHLQMLKYNFPTMKANLGSVLQTFFQLYGRMFNLCISGVRVKDGGSYFDKFDRYETTPNDTMRFSVEDPNDETNELGRNGYGASRVRKAFNNASITLINWRRDDSAAAPTPLGAILHYNDLLQLRRADVIEDMEQSGLKPLRESLPNAIASHKVGSVKVTPSSILPATSSSDKESRGNLQDGQSRSASNSKPVLHSGHGVPARDPRLLKRRRGHISERINMDGRENALYEVPTRSTQIQGNSRGQAANRIGGQQSSFVARHEELNDLGTNNHTTGPGTHTLACDYPVQQYPVSTPGYQYVEQPATLEPVGSGIPRTQSAVLPYSAGDSVPTLYTNHESYNNPSRRSRPKRGRSHARRRAVYRGR